MAEKTEIEVEIKPDGTVTITTHGLRGQACVTETKAMEQALGTVRRREKTSEYYMDESGQKTKLRER
jgi:hypothetical protein